MIADVDAVAEEMAPKQQIQENAPVVAPDTLA